MVNILDSVSVSYSSQHCFMTFNKIHLPLRMYSGPTSCDGSGILTAVQVESSSDFQFLPNGNIEVSYSTQLAYCVNNTNYGICRTGFDEQDAVVACRYFQQFSTNGYTVSSK